MAYHWDELTPFEALPDRGEGVKVAVPEKILKLWGNFQMPKPPSEERTAVSFNFVQTLDGVASYGVQGFAGGGVISTKREDRWMMDAYRTMTDAIVLGAETVRTEDREIKRRREASGRPLYEIDGMPTNGFVATVEDPELAEWRRRTRGERHPVLVVITASGELPEDLGIFDLASQRILIFTTPAGESVLREMMRNKRRFANVETIPFGGIPADLPLFLTGILKQKFGIRYALCEGGPATAGAFLQDGLDDELLLTVAPLLATGKDEGGQARKRIVEGPDFYPATAFEAPGLRIPPGARRSPEYLLHSVRRHGDHMFFRYWRQRS